MGNCLVSPSQIPPTGADACSSLCPISSNDIYVVLGQAFQILKQQDRTFMCKKKELYCLYKKYRCLIDPIFPSYYLFVKDCYGNPLLLFIGTIGRFAVDVVLYKDIFDWIILDTGSCRRKYKDREG